jgi:hypothetical protein
MAFFDLSGTRLNLFGYIQNMDKILSFIEKETNGKCYTSFKFCYDGVAVPSIEYEDKPRDKINLKEYGETDHSPHVRDLIRKVKQPNNLESLFKFFLDGSRRTNKVDVIGTKIFPLLLSSQFM